MTHTSKIKVLIVEDDVVSAKLLHEMLVPEEGGAFEVTRAATAKEAQESLSRSSVDVLLLDLNLPDSRGMHTLVLFRELCSSGAIVVVTGEGGDTSGVTAVRNGAQEYLVKGAFDAPRLKRALLHALEHKQIESEQRDAVQRMQESKARYKSLVNQIPVGLYRNLPGPHGSFVMANPALVKMFGYDSFAELQTVSAVDMYANPEDRKRFLAKLLETGSVAGEELLLKRKDASVLWASVTANVIRDDKGNVQYLDGMIEDVTERKKSESQLRMLFEGHSEGVCIVTEDAECLRVNAKFRKLFSVDLNECYSGKWYDLLAAKCDCAWADEWKSVLNSRGVYEREIIVSIKDEKMKVVSVMFVQMTSDEGRYYIGYFRDITDKRRRENETLALEKELQQAHKLEAIGTLAAGVAHEINTPIQFISNNTGFLGKAIQKLLDLVATYRELLHTCDDGENTKKAHSAAEECEKKSKLSFLEKEIPRALNQTKDGADRVAKIVGAMKDFSHMGNEEMTEEDINQAVESTVTISKNEWKYVAEMKMVLDPSLPMISCLIGDIKQVVLNLVVNAAHAIKDALDITGKKQGCITVKTFVKDAAVFITVSDTGTGIPEEARSKVFDHFFTTKEVGKGTGQGLSMAYQTIVEKHKGKLSFETEVGAGTTFIIELPMQ